MRSGILEADLILLLIKEFYLSFAPLFNANNFYDVIKRYKLGYKKPKRLFLVYIDISIFI